MRQLSMVYAMATTEHTPQPLSNCLKARTTQTLAHDAEVYPLLLPWHTPYPTPCQAILRQNVHVACKQAGPCAWVSTDIMIGVTHQVSWYALHTCNTSGVYDTRMPNSHGQVLQAYSCTILSQAYRSLCHTSAMISAFVPCRHYL